MKYALKYTCPNGESGKTTILATDLENAVNQAKNMLHNSAKVERTDKDGITTLRVINQWECGGMSCPTLQISKI